MLLIKTIIIKWHHTNKEWYESKGYVFTNWKEELKIKVEDLPKGSNVFIEVKCDCEDCKDPYLKPIKFQTYTKYVKEDGKYYCHKCAIKLFSGKTAVQNKLKNGSKSFEQWCLENNRQDILDRWDNELNAGKANEVCYKSSKKYWFKCPLGEHLSELKSINNFVIGYEGAMICNYCNSFANWGIITLGDDFLSRYWSDRNTVSPWEISKRTDSFTVLIKCQEKDYHEDYETNCDKFVRGYRCIYCKGVKIHPFDSLGKLLEDKGLLHLWSDKNNKSPYEFPPHTHQKVHWKCECGKHEDYERNIDGSYSSEFRCAKCVDERKESVLQEKTKNYLLNLGYEVLHEQFCSIKPKNIIEHPTIKRKGYLRYDNEIIINNQRLIIEVHGSQHYNADNKWHLKSSEKYNTTIQQEFEYIQAKDRYKRIYAKSKGYFFLELPYYAFDKEDTYKTLINNKINEIKQLNNT